MSVILNMLSSCCCCLISTEQAQANGANMFVQVNSHMCELCYGMLPCEAAPGTASEGRRVLNDKYGICFLRGKYICYGNAKEYSINQIWFILFFHNSKPIYSLISFIPLFKLAVYLLPWLKFINSQSQDQNIVVGDSGCWWPNKPQLSCSCTFVE